MTEKSKFRPETPYVQKLFCGSLNFGWRSILSQQPKLYDAILWTYRHESWPHVETHWRFSQKLYHIFSWDAPHSIGLILTKSYRSIFNKSHHSCIKGEVQIFQGRWYSEEFYFLVSSICYPRLIWYDFIRIASDVATLSI